VFLLWSIKKKQAAEAAAEDVAELEEGVGDGLIQKSYAEVPPAPELEFSR